MLSGMSKLVNGNVNMVMITLMMIRMYPLLRPRQHMVCNFRSPFSLTKVSIYYRYTFCHFCLQLYFNDFERNGTTTCCNLKYSFCRQFVYGLHPWCLVNDILLKKLWTENRFTSFFYFQIVSWVTLHFVQNQRQKLLLWDQQIGRKRWKSNRRISCRTWKQQQNWCFAKPCVYPFWCLPSY